MTDEEIAARVGMVVDGWTLKRVVGRGGMAAVYEGVSEDGSRAAVKLLHDEYIGKGTVQRRFLREAFIIGVVNHHAAIKIHKQGMSGATPFFAMEFVDGETLHSRWSALGKMPPETVVGYAKSLLEILAAYHAEGVVHRDIKPANLLVVGDGLRLIDFGVARYRDMGMKASEYTRDGATLGTPPFMPPEQAMGKIDRIDQRSDIFAVGAVMYSLLSGRFVHEGGSNDELLVSAATRPAESVIAVAPSLPDNLVRIIDKALAFYPSDRYQNATEMLDALKAVVLEKTAEEKKILFVAPERVAKVGAMAAVVGEGVEPMHTNIAEAVEVMFRGIKRVFDAAQLYDLAHPEVDRRVEEAHSLITDILAEYPDECGFQVRMASFDIDGKPVWTPKAPFDQVPYRLFINGFRFIRFVPGLPRDELRAFLNLIMAPASELAMEDDLATALWDLDLRHVDASMVTSFAISDDVHMQNQFELELSAAVEEEQKYLSREGANHIELLALVAAAGAGGLAHASMMSREAIAAHRFESGSFAARFRDQFVEALNRDVWELRTALVLGAAIQDGWAERDLNRIQQTVETILPRYLLQGRDAAGFELAERVVRGTTNAEVRGALLEWLFRPKNVARLMIRLRWDDQNWDDDTRKRASGLLAEAPADGIEEILELFGETSPSHRRIVMTHMMRHGLGRQQRYADIGLGSIGGPARDIVQILERIEDPETPRALVRMLEHPDEGVRETVLTSLSTRFPSAVEQVLLPMISDESPNVRVQALRLARSIKSQIIRDALAEQIHSNKFHTLPFTERKLTVETLHKVDPALAEQVCVDLARKKLHLSLDPAVHTTRIMVLGFLGEKGLTREGWEALEDAAKRRPGNPQNIREAATAAIERWRSRAQ